MAVPGGDAVRRLQAFIVEHQLEITTAPPEPGLGGHEGVVLVVSAPQNPALRITVFDEYGDARPDNPALCLALLNMQFRELGNAGGEMGRWAIAEGLDPAAAKTQTAFAQNQAAHAAFLAAYGPIPDVVSDLDWQLNAGPAQALRGLR
ncbi:hypothetical protein [uncultured Maricaulis sp.]|uniref:hypothetical protein n=1 Tax=uncultured Maricaulis sp. TaxID=174710 RepID=UPI0030DD25AA|tara:strand:+ start:794 stop:1237 length:444 start_codon:yes stop_codon:yes gene_type:complete